MSVSTQTKSPEDLQQAEYAVLLPLCVAAFSGLLNVSVLGPFVAVIAADLDASVPRIGFTATVALVTTALSGLVVGWLADTGGYRRVLVGGLALLSISGLGAALAVNYLFFLLARVIGAVGFAAANGLPNAIVASRYEGIARRRSLGIISAAGVLAGFIGPPVLTFVGDFTSWRVAFALVGGFALLAGIGVRLSVPPPETNDGRQASLKDGIELYKALLRDRVIQYVFAATILQMASLIGAMVYVGAFLTTETGLSVRYVGFAFAAQSIGGFLGGLLAGRLPSERDGLAYTVTIGMLATSLLGIYALALPVAFTAGFMALAGCSQVMAWVALTGVLARVTPVGQGSTMVLNGSMLGVGGAIGSAIGGLVIGSFGYEALGMVLAGIAVASGLAMWRALRRNDS